MVDAADRRAVLKVAEAIAHEAGWLLRDGLLQAKEVRSKSSAVDWVTQFDLASEALIASRLAEAFPDDGLVGEEGAESDSISGYTWFVDPLDGTVNYAHGLRQFCVSLARVRDGVADLGVVYDPMSGECFTAITGEGAFVDLGPERSRLQVSTRVRLDESLLATGFPADRHTSAHDNLAQVGAFLKRAHGIRRAGSAALDIAYVAAGRHDGYWEFKLNPWDMAAATLMVTEAGGRVSGPDGRPLPVQPGKMTVVASNGRVHDAMLAVLAETAPH